MESGFSDTMTRGERKAAASLAAVYAVRMLGLFMIFPVFSVYASTLTGTTPFLAGLALGIYGFTQAALQIPLGMLSDRFGRKRVIVAGLLVFAFGSVVAGMSDSIYGVLLGRALQGGGAVAAALMALAADLTREEHRTKVMAVIGMSIGIAFSVGIVAGPALEHWVGVSGIFWTTAVMALGAIALIIWVVPQPVSARLHRDTEAVPAYIRAVLSNPQLLRLDLGIFSLHLVLTANFVVIPLILSDHIGLASNHLWLLYLPVLVLSFAAMLPMIVLAEKYRRMKPVFVGAIAVLALAELSLALGDDSLAALATSLLLFFWAFNLLEASLPSLVAKFAPPDRKGTAMGVYSSSQFMGIFVGGVAGGAVHAALGIRAVFGLGLLAIVIWLFAALTMKRPRYLSSFVLNVGPLKAAQAGELAIKLTQVRGVAEAVVIAEDGVAYLKVDRHALDKAALREFSVDQE